MVHGLQQEKKGLFVSVGWAPLGKARKFLALPKPFQKQPSC
jgi:hypothetical protein